MTDTIAIVGSPTALGGHFGGMERAPADLRRAGLIDRLRSRPRLAGAAFVDHGDAPNDPGWAPDPDPVMKNRQLIIDYLGRLARHVETSLAKGRAKDTFPRDASGVINRAAGGDTRGGGSPSGGSPSSGSPGGGGPSGDPSSDPSGGSPSSGSPGGGGPSGEPSSDPSSGSPSSGSPGGGGPSGGGRHMTDYPTGITGKGANPPARSGQYLEDAPRLLVLGGDCTTHAGTMAALKRANPGARLAIAWFDAHGDFNVPATTPSGNVWGMPFAMLCGRGDPGLVAACDGPTVREEDAALLGAQVLDEQESRMLAASPVAQFGAGVLNGAAGQAALEGWARAVGARCDGLYIAFDLDAIDASEGVCVAMPEPDGLSVETSIAALRILAATNKILGFGPTATMRRSDVSDQAFDQHVDIVARLTEAALA